MSATHRSRVCSEGVSVIYRTKKTAKHREAFTLVELMVAIAIILAIVALAAAFVPRISDSAKLTRAIDNLEQWLLTAKMRAKREGLATGVRFVQTQGDASGTYSQLQYIQQADPLSGGMAVSNTTAGAYAYPSDSTSRYYTGGLCLPTTTAGQVELYNVDVTMGQTLPANQYLIRTGDYLQVHEGGAFQIASATSSTTNPPLTTIHLAGTTYDASLNISAPTTDFRMFRQPRILIGESPLVLPDNFAVSLNILPGTSSPGSNVLPNATGLFHEILFAPSGAIVASNAGNGTVLMSVYDQTMTPFDSHRVGIIAVRCRTGSIGAYSAAPGADPFYFAEIGLESGL